MKQIYYIRRVVSTLTAGMVLAGVLCAAWVTARAEKLAGDFENVPGVGHPPTGRDLYQVSCAACHGVDGSGASRDRVGFDQALPDFTDCNFATREANLDWIAVAQEGGPARAFSPLMPAFGDALTAKQSEAAIDHIRTFCGNDWPRGELNLPRPLVTTKAFPEDELVVSGNFVTEGLDAIDVDVIYEQRFGTRNQAEIIVPLLWHEQINANGGTKWKSGVGDIGLGLKRVVFHSLESGSILSLGGEVLLPTGNDEDGFGSGTTIFEPYVAYGQLLPRQFFLHTQVGAGIPWDDDKSNEEAFWRMALGRAFYENGGYGRRWAPMIELLGARELVSGADDQWDVVPQIQVTLSPRQHVRLGFGAKIPINNTANRRTSCIVYLLWDWFDGGLFQGWSKE